MSESIISLKSYRRFAASVEKELHGEDEKGEKKAIWRDAGNKTTRQQGCEDR